MQPRWVVRLDDELPNLRAAVNWLLERGEGRTALRLLTAAEDYWSQRRPNNVELCRWLTAALAAAPEAPATDRTVAHYLLALVNSILGNEEDAAMHAQRLLSAAQESGEPAALGLAQYGVGMVWEFHGHGERAAAALTEAVPLLQEPGTTCWPRGRRPTSLTSWSGGETSKRESPCSMRRWRVCVRLRC